MKKSIKQTAGLIMSLGLALSGTTGVYGAAPAAALPSVTEGVVAAETSGVETTLNGTIKATTLSVTIPLTTAFDIDPTKYSEADPNVQIGSNQSGGYKIVNNSAVPVYVYISGVTVPTSGVTLVDNVSALSTDKALMLAISQKASASASDISNADFWLKTTMSDKYYMDETQSNKGKLDANGGEMALKLYGMTKQGWSNDDKFAVKPSFTVTVTEPS